MQVSAYDTPLPVRYEERKDKPTTANAISAGHSPHTQDRFIQTADRVTVKRQQLGRSPSLQAVVSILPKPQ